MIRIIAGAYGYRGHDGVVRLKTPASGPFKETAEQEAKLIKLGVAEAVEEKPATVKKEASKKCPPSKTKS